MVHGQQNASWLIRDRKVFLFGGDLLSSSVRTAAVCAIIARKSLVPAIKLA